MAQPTSSVGVGGTRTSTNDTSTTKRTPPPARTRSSNTTSTKKKKKKKNGRAPIPLVKGTTAASLAKNGTASGGGKRKRTRNNSSNSNNNSKKNNSNHHDPLFSSTAESLSVISEYHTLNKRLEQTEAADESAFSSAEAKRDAIRLLQRQQAAMGGLDRYQKASIYGARSSKFVCADWVVPLLKKELELELERNTNGNTKTKTTNNNNSNKNTRRLRILDVGAIDNQYHGKGYDDWLDAVPIDLHGGQHESVLQVDFFDYAHGYIANHDHHATANATGTSSSNKNNSNNNDRATKNNAKTKQSPTPPPPSPPPFDAIVMSLVLNFQGDPRKRGDMLALAADPRLLKSRPPEYVDDHDDRATSNTAAAAGKSKSGGGGGMLFVALPSASLDNSRYCDLDRFVEVATNPLFQLELVETKRSSKLILLAFRRTPQRRTRTRTRTPTTTTTRGGGGGTHQDAGADKKNGTPPKTKPNRTAPNHPPAATSTVRDRSPSSRRCYYYDASNKTFDYGPHERKRLQPAKPGAKRNNFAVILKSSHNRTGSGTQPQPRTQTQTNATRTSG